MKTGSSLNLNLLPSQAKFQAARMKQQAILKRYMSLLIITWVVAIIVVGIMYFGSDFILSFQNKKYDQALRSYKGLSQEIVINQLLKYRAKVLGVVLKDRFEYSSAFEKINSIFSEKAKVADFQLSKNKEFSLVVAAVDKEAVSFVEDKVTEANEGKVEGVKSIDIIGASYKVDSGWTVSMEVVLL